MPDPINKEPSRTEIAKEERWVESWTLWAIPVALIVSFLMHHLAIDGFKDSWFVSGNLLIAIGYVFIAFNIAPYFDTDRDTKVAAILFFATCAATHVELALHTAFSDGMDLTDLRSWHSLFIHALQPVALWRFLFGLRKAAIIERERIIRLERREANITEREDALDGG